LSLEQFLYNDLIKLNIECNDQDEFFELMFNEAKNKGFVEDTFLSKIKERESVFPTGLAMNNYSVAIPHTDPEQVKEQFIAIATLKRPVKFSLMSDASQQTNVNVIFMLGLNQPHSQLSTLQQLMGMIQDSSNIEKLLAATNSDEVREVIKSLETTNI